MTEAETQPIDAADPEPEAGPREPDLAALVSARLCHDLISPIGAIGNGLELLQMADERDGPELALIGESLATALAKLRFYRVAFGPADAEARISLDEAEAMTRDMFPSRFAAAWETRERDLARPLVKLVFLALLCFEKSLPMGGRVRVAVDGDDVALAVEGRRTAPPAELWAHAIDGAPVAALRSDGVQFALLRQALDAAGGTIAMRGDDASLDLTLSLPAPA